jgi:hypothetical protein
MPGAMHRGSPESQGMQQPRNGLQPKVGDREPAEVDSTGNAPEEDIDDRQHLAVEREVKEGNHNGQ